MMPMILLPSATTRGVAPSEATLFTSWLNSGGALPPLPLTNLRMASEAPFRIFRPSGRSIPLMRVWAVNGTNLASSGASAGEEPLFSYRCTMLFPSGVASEAEAIAASLPTSEAEYFPTGKNVVAFLLPMVIVPVLSRSTTSTSPASSTAFPLLAIMFA